ncbi:MAG: sigma-54-dependent Fis family transcriptional regulator [Alphaproteobacteria bacterium]|nr:sigma-54-dependent Fis family transcriptional regulator [Alphaproteobacteria bacterium]
MSGSRILVIDDHTQSAELLVEALCFEGYDARAFADGAAGMAWLRREGADVVLTDLRMAGMDGIEVLGQVQAIDDAVPVMILTAHATLDSAVRATRGGAFAFITKPVKLPHLLVQVRNAATQCRLARSVAGADRGDSDPIIGGSAALLRALAIADRAARSDASVLITGESGTGKELFARRIHARGARGARRFVAVNCGAIPDSLIESELFGHVRGAFTGADRDREGLVEAAHGGTLFLDEIGELSAGAQTRLLRFLQEGSYRRVGESRDRQADVRVVAATHRTLPSADFREDLYYRLNVVPVQLPPLRARPDDVPLLLGAALAPACGRQARPVLRLSRDACDALLRYRWPGNVRELFNLAERMAVLCPSDVIELEDLPAEMSRGDDDGDAVRLPTGDFDLQLFLEGIESRALRRALDRAGGVKAHAAASLGLERNTFRYKLAKYGIDDE